MRHRTVYTVMATIKEDCGTCRGDKVSTNFILNVFNNNLRYRDHAVSAYSTEDTT
jgi:hypothetical protein